MQSKGFFFLPFYVFVYLVFELSGLPEAINVALVPSNQISPACDLLEAENCIVH